MPKMTFIKPDGTRVEVDAPLGLSVLGYWREVLMLWIFPHILASALIIYFFAYLTHKPHEVHERYRDTNIFWVKGKIMEPIVNWLYMFQNFHLIHHLSGGDVADQLRKRDRVTGTGEALGCHVNARPAYGLLPCLADQAHAAGAKSE